eukprot:1999917-Pyramimonas_sp.AAC.1
MHRAVLDLPLRPRRPARFATAEVHPQVWGLGYRFDGETLQLGSTGDSARVSGVGAHNHRLLGQPQAALASSWPVFTTPRIKFDRTACLDPVIF